MLSLICERQNGDRRFAGDLSNPQFGQLDEGGVSTDLRSALMPIHSTPATSRIAQVSEPNRAVRQPPVPRPGQYGRLRLPVTASGG